MDFETLNSVLPVLPLLLGLALVDSLSFGTLAIPVWLLIAPGRPRPHRVLLYLLIIAGFYFVVGALLLQGIDVLLPLTGIDWNDPAVHRFLFFVGAGLVVLSFAIDTKKQRERRAERAASGDTRLGRWRRAITGESEASGSGSSPGGSRTKPGLRPVLMLALVAGILEVATMLPYLAGIGIISANDVPENTRFWLLGGYSLVMILPAIVLLIARLIAGKTVIGPLTRLDDWFNRKSGSAFAWIIGIVGAVIVVHTLPAMQ
ncbi:GAP family protein [Nesterenkonia populi]